MDLDIVRDDKLVYRINGNLLKHKFPVVTSARKALKEIKALHHEKLDICDLMNVMDPVEDRESLIECDKELDNIEFKLQKAWGFPEDAKFHMFWERPYCTCAKLDNYDAYPGGIYSMSGECPLYGRFVNKAPEEFNKVMPGTDSDDFIYKNPLNYRIKSALEVGGFLTLIGGSLYLFYLLVTNQDALKEFAKYLIGA